jgi:hypothetical protein
VAQSRASPDGALAEDPSLRLKNGHAQDDSHLNRI